MWTNKKPKHLPLTKGPYIPGATDVMLDYSVNGLFMRIYYPTNLKASDDDNLYKKWIPWIPDNSYIEGIAAVLMLFPIFIKGLFWWGGNTLIPAVYGEKIRNEKKLKCIIFSHGLGGSRFLYSNVCCELASNGFVVFAIEHRDRSASHTYYYQNKDHAELDMRTHIKYKIVSLNDKHYHNRNEQVKLRSQECSRCLDFILNLNKGEVPENIMDRVPTAKKSDFKLNDLVGILDIDNIIMMGHSFGGATALLTLGTRPELKLGVLMDPWMFSIKNDNLYEKIKSPLIFINTQTFHISTNVAAMKKYLESCTENQMYTILHTTHENQCDSVLLIGYWLNWFMKKLEPRSALKINNALIVKFISQHLGYPENVTGFEDFLNEESVNYEKGLTKPWV